VLQGAFYVFSDFEFYREQLLRMGKTTSRELCSRVLDDTGVAMLPGSDFGRDETEFSARIAYVNFNGREAMDAADMLSNGEKNHEDFVVDYCPKITEAVERLGNWLVQ
jgi:aspartate/methionine/tyrosine aminotransferase